MGGWIILPVALSIYRDFNTDEADEADDESEANPTRSEEKPSLDLWDDDNNFHAREKLDLWDAENFHGRLRDDILLATWWR